MARAEAIATSDSEDEKPTTARGGAAGKSNRSKTKREPTPEQSEGEDGGSDDEPEYEIEAILDHKSGVVKQGHMAYFVKWKGYDEAENSWIDEDDAGGAREMIDEYMERQKKKKSSAAKARPSAISGSRKSLAGRGDSEETSLSVSKRGKGASARATKLDSDDESKPAKLKSTGDTGSKHAAKKRKVEELTDDPSVAREVYGDLFDKMKEASWENYVSSIDTVEHSTNGELMVYFRTVDGKMCRQPSRVAAAKFPQQLIEFYENNLKWRSTVERD